MIERDQPGLLRWLKTVKLPLTLPLVLILASWISFLVLLFLVGYSMNLRPRTSSG